MMILLGHNKFTFKYFSEITWYVFRELKEAYEVKVFMYSTF